jgi:acetyl-CoA/propionyl-CoA carboxylase biotin carboxyl carrier protein
MLAKIIARGDDRAAAIDRLARALDETLVLGLTTNLRFLRWLVRQTAFQDGMIRTDTLDRIWPPDDWAERAAIPDAAWTTAAGALLGAEASAAATDPWAGGWRLNAPAAVRLSAGDETRTVRPAPTSDAPHEFETVVAGDTVHVAVAGRSVAFRRTPPPDIERAARAASRATAGDTADLLAPMPGQVLLVHASPGGRVEAGQPVITLEAMKMEHAVTAPMDGVLADIEVRVGDQVASGQRLASVTVAVDGGEGPAAAADA